MPNVGDGTGFDGFPPESEGLSHYAGDEANKLSGVVNDVGTGAHGGSGGEGGSNNTPIGKQPDEKEGLRNPDSKKGSSSL